MYRSPVVLRRLRVFDLPSIGFTAAPLHRYHGHDLLEWIVDNKPEFLHVLLQHWGVESSSAWSLEKCIREVALLLYNRRVDVATSEGLRGIIQPPEMNTVTWKKSKTWNLDTMRLERQHFRPTYPLFVKPDYRNSIDSLGRKLGLRFVHPCRYMNWIQYEQENDNSIMWRFAPSGGQCRSNYYEETRCDLQEIGINGNFVPLLSYGSTQNWITYSTEELEESLRRGRIPLSLPLDDGKEFFEAKEDAIVPLHNFLMDLRGSIYDPFLRELRNILDEQIIMTKNLLRPTTESLVRLNDLAYQLRPGEEVVEGVMEKFYPELFFDLVTFTRAPSFQCLHIPLRKVYEKAFEGNMCCADFAEMVLTTTQVYARKFQIEIEYEGYGSRRSHIDYYGRQQLLPNAP